MSASIIKNKEYNWEQYDFDYIEKIRVRVKVWVS